MGTASPPSSKSRMFSVLWICTPSLLASACSRAVFPEEGDREGWEAGPRAGSPQRGTGNTGARDQKMTSQPGLRVTGFWPFSPPTLDGEKGQETQDFCGP